MPDRDVRIRVPEQADKQVMLSIDGEGVEVLDGDEIRVRRSKDALLMAKVSDRSFYDIVFEKLNDKNWTERSKKEMTQAQAFLGKLGK